MRSYIASAVLAASTFSQAVLGASLGHSHAHLHEKKAVAVEERAVTSWPFLSPTDVTKLVDLGITQLGTNAADSGNGANNVWVGNADNAPFVGNFVNNATEDIIVVIWKNSFVQTAAPYVTHTIQSGTSTLISFAAPAGAVSNAGGWAAIYPNTVISDAGQVQQTWAEFGFTTNMYDSSTFDISRMISMSGNPMTIENDSCTADLNTCAYTCPAGMETCWGCPSPDGSPCGLLANCETGSQPGAAPGAGYTAGGCQTKANSGTFTVTFK